MDEACGRSDGGAHRGEVGRIDKGRLDAVLLRQQLREQAVRRLVDDIRNNEVVAGLQEGENTARSAATPLARATASSPLSRTASFCCSASWLTPLLRM